MGRHRRHGMPVLEPEFVIDTPGALLRSGGDYGITGRTVAGDELFSLRFEMPELADGDGRSPFAFALSVQSEWAGELASITLSRPGGSVTLDEETERPVTILRNRRTGQVRGILRDLPAAAQARADSLSALSVDLGLEALTSCGIPEPGDWRR